MLAAEEARAERLEAAVLRLAGLREHLLTQLVHDVRTPLSVLLGNTELLLEELAGPLTAKQRKMLSAVQRQAQLLADAADGLRTAALETDPVGAPCEPASVDRRLASLRRPALRIAIDGASWPEGLPRRAMEEALQAVQALLAGEGTCVLAGRPRVLLVPVDGDIDAACLALQTRLDTHRPRVRGVRRSVRFVVALDDDDAPGNVPSPEQR